MLKKCFFVNFGGIFSAMLIVKKRGKNVSFFIFFEIVLTF